MLLRENRTLFLLVKKSSPLSLCLCTLMWNSDTCPPHQGVASVMYLHMEGGSKIGGQGNKACIGGLGQGAVAIS